MCTLAYSDMVLMINDTLELGKHLPEIFFILRWWNLAVHGATEDIAIKNTLDLDTDRLMGHFALINKHTYDATWSSTMYGMVSLHTERSRKDFDPVW